MKLHLKWPNWLLALLSTLVTVAASLFIYSPGIGYGGWLMITLPLAPVVFVSLWIAYALSAWFGRLKARKPAGQSQVKD